MSERIGKVMPGDVIMPGDVFRRNADGSITPLIDISKDDSPVTGVKNGDLVPCPRCSQAGWSYDYGVVRVCSLCRGTGNAVVGRET